MTIPEFIEERVEDVGYFFSHEFPNAHPAQYGILTKKVRAGLQDLLAEVGAAVEELVNKYWTFDEFQQHTHSWHSKQGFLDDIKALLNPQTERMCERCLYSEIACRCGTSDAKPQ